MGYVAVHQVSQPLDSVDAVAVGDQYRLWIIFADRLDHVQCDMLREHIQVALGSPDHGVRCLTVPYGATLTMQLAPCRDQELVQMDGPGGPDDLRYTAPQS